MAHLTADRVKETTTTTGTGAITLAGAIVGFRAFSSVLAIGDTCYYSLASLPGAEWEVGIGTYSALNTLTRTTVLSSSNAGAAVTFSAGTKEIFITAAASRFLQEDAAGNVGLGTDTPQKLLHLSSTTNGAAIRIQADNGGTIAGDIQNAIEFFNNDATVGTQRSTASIKTINTDATFGRYGRLGIFTASGVLTEEERLTIDNAGNVGIGVVAPTNKLEVNGAISGTSFNSITGLSSTTPVVAGTAAVGTGTTAARGDHVHPAQTTVSGNAGTATTLATARNINGVSFNGSADITVAAAAGTLTGATLASGVTASSLTSVGTLGSLAVTGIATAAGGIRSSDTSFPTYQILLDFGADLTGTWRKIITATLQGSPATYSTHGFKIKITDPNANHATQGSVNVDEVVYYVACVRTESTVIDTPDLCVVRGPAQHVRAVKTATGSYEIQVQPEGQYREYLITIESYATNGSHTIVYSNGSTTGSAGTATYSAAVGGATTWVDKLQSTGTITGTQLVSNIATGTAPLAVTSTTLVTNLNADLLDGLQSATANTVSTIVARDASGNFSAGTITAALTGNASTATSVGNLTGIATVAPLVAGTAAVGTSTLGARQDHVHPAQTTVSGNAGTATTLATARTFALSGAATGTATSFDGSANITIPVTSLNAANLSGTVPNASLAGTYSGITLKVDGTNSIFSLPTVDNTNARAVSHLVDYRSNSATATGAIVFTATAGTSVMHQMEITGLLYTTPQIIDLKVQGYWTGTGWGQTKQVNLGSIAVQARWGRTAGGLNCLILGDVGTVWSYPHITVARALFGHNGANDAYAVGWTAALVTDLSTYTNIVEPTVERGLTSLTYNSYSPTLTGTGASGSWGISVTGSSASCTGNAATATSVGSLTGIATVAPLAAGTAAVGTSTLGARQDHVHPAQTTVSGNAGTVTNGVYTTDQVVTSRSTAVSTNTGDWNSQVTAGSYQVSGNGTWTGSTNGPTAAYAYGQLLVYVNGTVITQHYFAHAITGNYSRTKFNASDWTVWQEVWTNQNDGSGSGLDADLLDGLELHTARNNEVNKVVRTDGSGYIQAGWINTTSGDNGTTAIDRVYASSDGYIRYYTPTNFRTVLNVPTRTGGDASGSWGISVTGSSASCTGNAATATTATNQSGGTVSGTSVQGSYLGVNNTTSTNGYGISLFSGATAGQPTYGIMFQGTPTFGTHGSVTADWATYFTMDSTANRGWIFRDTTNGNKASINNAGTAVFNGNVTAYSDIRLKTNIVVINDAVNKVKQLRGVTFDRTDTANLGRQTGVIAQEVLEVLPEAVIGTEETTYSVAYGNMVGLLIEAIKEQQNTIDSLEDRISRLEEMLNK